jgi:undecaprenyl diphosphate synthase
MEQVSKRNFGGPFPEHIAIIMDGNGRWAQERGMLRVQGHSAGVTSVREVTTECARMGVKSLTLYAFSMENWKRPSREVGYLMRLLRVFLHRERRTLMDNGVRLRCIGRLDELPPPALLELRRTEAMTAENQGMVLRLALSYGSRTEIGDAVRQIAKEAALGELDPETIDEETLRAYLYDPVTPDPDLVIRTAGEMRISNFLLWQMSYAELFVTDVCWPEFRLPHLTEALASYAKRKRKYGGLLDESPTDGDERATDSRSTA